MASECESCHIGQEFSGGQVFGKLFPHERHVLDIYTPEKATDRKLPVMFWIHGGGWHVGDKSDVALKPKVLTERGGASFLCVIKDFGREGRGVLSFPRPGITLALDIAIRDDTQALVDALNEQVLQEGGRIYLAKDSFTRREHFEEMERPRLDEFTAIRDRWDPDRRFRSAQSVRLLGD